LKNFKLKEFSFKTMSKKEVGYYDFTAKAARAEFLHEDHESTIVLSVQNGP
jgi:hypothetical protein